MCVDCLVGTGGVNRTMLVGLKLLNIRTRTLLAIYLYACVRILTCIHAYIYGPRRTCSKDHARSLASGFASRLRGTSTLYNQYLVMFVTALNPY